MMRFFGVDIYVFAGRTNLRRCVTARPGLDPESGLDAIRSVGIRGKKIAAISASPLRGAIEVDSTGLVIAPGFIDLHSHGQTPKTIVTKRWMASLPHWNWKWVSRLLTSGTQPGTASL
jgi:cytosine/adenosine deaminase-related metal-dependent hydrolase